MTHRLTPAEAASHLGLTDRSIRRRIDAGLLAAEAQPGPGGIRYLIEMAEIDRYKRDHPQDRSARPVEKDEERLDLIVRHDDKKQGHFDWRDATRLLREMQQMQRAASWSQDTLQVSFPNAEKPIFVLPLCDTHLGDWATDYALFEQIVDDIMAHDDVYLMLLGDLTQLAIKMRSVAEVSSNLLPPDMQMTLLEAVLDEIKERVLCATWSNHEAEREEKQSGISMYKYLLSRRVAYFNGIGHLDVQVGQQTYKIAVSHLFRGRTMYNPVHGAQRYLRMEAHDREIACAGDSHVPGMMKYIEGGRVKLALNGGSIQASPFGKRYFSPLNHPDYPGFTLHHEQHHFAPFWAYAEYNALR